MSIALPELTHSQMTELVDEMNSQGFASVPNYIADTDLQRMQQFVGQAMEHSGYQYVHFNGPSAVAGSGLDEISSSEEFLKLIHGIYELGTGSKAIHEDLYQVLRCLSGSTGLKNSLIFHYDSYVVTALVPLRIPTEGQTGDLLMYPNTRSIRPHYLLNAVDKVLLDNTVTQHLLRRLVNTSYMPPTRIKMVPGNLYLFWGYRSVHTNEPCDPAQVRATAIYHYRNPHRKQVN